jgi:hypothetical protein
LTGLTLSLCIDVGIYLAEALRALYPNLRWELWTSGTMGFNRPVVVGFQANVPMESPRIVANIALQRVGGQASPAALRKVFDVWANRAE